MPLLPAIAGGTKNNINKGLLLLTKSGNPPESRKYGAESPFVSGAILERALKEVRSEGDFEEAEAVRREDERRKLDGPIWPFIQKRTQERTQSRAGGHPLGLCPKPHAGALPPRPRRRKAPAGPIASGTA